MSDEAFDFLNALPNSSDVTEMRTFALFLDSFEVRVELYDRGPDGGLPRYSAYAYREDLPATSRTKTSRGESLGDPADTIQDALAHVDWDSLTS